jgi:hypothetical protein
LGFRHIAPSGIRATSANHAAVAVLEDEAVRVSRRTSVDREELGVRGDLLRMLVGATGLSADAVFVRTH